ncbi:MAG: ABC transporter substrate-binding protein [Syntrophorhabdus aromaticivorans]|uniref:ABC transporter substrate-binding protein n=1 Tax=Syntrophorhabdus aromaticivorans TaxID=328301 RepID=A0A351TZ72_9BACT|nr:ABC transporter substrate-binding protein [Syntrophorhabdus aromaticivorans]HBA53003.1 ABC transporter substrate-binding protein [Syntrophorhabdus aromaticivorans]
MKRLVLATTLIVMLTFTAFASFAEPSPTEKGERDVPQRIVSLGPSITEALFLLGVESRVVGVTTYCRKPSRAKEKEKVGTVMEINAERIIRMKPDLVLATSLTSMKDMAKLEDLGIRVAAFDISKDLNHLSEVFLSIGRLVGKEAKARSLLEGTRKRLTDTRKAVAGLKKKKVFVQLGAKPLFGATKDDFINDLIEFAGGTNIFKDLGSGLISREAVVRRNPDVIIIATMGITGEKERTMWQRYKTINAVRHGRIYLVDSDMICSLTPVSFVEALGEFVNILHGKTKKG